MYILSITVSWLLYWNISPYNKLVSPRYLCWLIWLFGYCSRGFCKANILIDLLLYWANNWTHKISYWACESCLSLLDNWSKMIVFDEKIVTHYIINQFYFSTHLSYKWVCYIHIRHCKNNTVHWSNLLNVKPKDIFNWELRDWVQIIKMSFLFIAA